VPRLSRGHDDGQIALVVVGLQALLHAEPIHAGHLQVEQDQVIGIAPVQRACLGGVHGGRDAGVARVGEQPGQQLHIGILIVDDQDAGSKNAWVEFHQITRSWSVRSDRAFAASRARSRVSMDSVTLILYSSVAPEEGAPNVDLTRV